MPENLFNYCTVELFEKELAASGRTLSDYVRQLGLDGVEQFIFSCQDVPQRHADVTVGVHLQYWPSWMDFWLQDAERLQRYFPDYAKRCQAFSGAATVSEWLERIRQNIRNACKVQPAYLVWHVSDANDEEIFTFRFHYSDREVLTAAAAVFNSVADAIPQETLVLFENLWWQGLNLRDPSAVPCFFALLAHRNVGMMLDTGHLLNTQPALRTEAEGADFICRTYDKLGPCAALIKGVHLSCSLSGEYQRSFPKCRPPELTAAQIWRHIASIDQHKPFQSDAARRILEYVQPQYVVHELFYDSLQDLTGKLQLQLAHCR